MWTYNRKLEYPVHIRKPDARAAKIILTQYGGPDGELGASLRYFSQRYTMPYRPISGLLTDIGTEEYKPSNYQYKKSEGNASLFCCFILSHKDNI